MARSYPTDIIEQGQAVLEAWRNIDPQLKIGELAPEALEAEIAKATPIQKQFGKLESQLTDLRNQRDALNDGIWEMLKRVRRGMQAIYGDDSSQYEMVGGTRTSERKPVARKIAVKST